MNRKILVNKFDKILKKQSEIKRCYAVDNENCCKTFTRAHSLSKSAVLELIAEDRHLLTIRQNDNCMDFVRVGIRDASSYYGFCNFHDTTLFENIDKNPFAINNRSAWEYHYRTLCHEIYKRENGIDVLRELELNGNDENEKERLLEIFERGLADCAAEKENMENVDAINNIKWVTFQFDNVVTPIVSSTLICPDRLWNGSMNFNINDFMLNAPLLSLNYIGSRNCRALAIFAWSSHEHDACKKYIESIEKLRGKIGNAILQIILEKSENTYFRQSWISSLDYRTKKRMIDYFEDSTLLGGTTNRTPLGSRENIFSMSYPKIQRNYKK